jgi:ribonuclease H / adenosylcobalamin/alpha-ribazole phosphatase
VSIVAVHLIRHAEHEGFGQRLTGRGTAALSDRGRAQARTLARHYEAAAIASLLSSPMQRAQETAGAVASAARTTVTVDPGLEEIDFGHWTGRSFDELQPMDGWRAWNAARGLAATPAGDTMAAAGWRAFRTLRRQAGGLVVAVTHADVIKAVLATLLGTPLDLSHRLEIGPASRSVVTLGPDWARVEAVNLPP